MSDIYHDGSRQLPDHKDEQVAGTLPAHDPARDKSREAIDR